MTPDKTSKAIDAFLNDCEAFGWSGAVCVKKGSQEVHSGAYGYRQDEARSDCDEDTLFDIGSLAETLTSAAVLNLVREGELSLDGTLAEVFPELPGHASAVTVRHLLRHSSGWSGRVDLDEGDGPGEVIAKLFSEAPVHPVGEELDVWPGNFIALAALVQVSSGQSFEAYVREEVLDPARMDSTRFYGEDRDADREAHGYEGRGDPRAAGEPMGSQDGWTVRGSGGVLSTAPEFADFLTALESGKIIKGDAWDALSRRGPGDQGLGWSINRDYQASCDRLEAAGEAPGFRAFASLNLGTKVACVVLSNRSDGPVRFMETTVRNFVSGEKMPVKQSIYPPETVAWKSKDLDALVGSWESEDGTELDLERYGDRSLRAQTYSISLATGSGIANPRIGYFAPVGKRELVNHAWVAGAKTSKLDWNGSKGKKAELVLTSPDGEVRTLERP